ncbi:DUF7604 domain-containing protein [[Clostridium] symbiosum]|uniref:DUF7604 domain-containing protein n=1 Tax=Clostridium symbiosum TaxID=1512 RepID=UPI001D08FD3F|nr:VWA domain-containing protein [[Clostridium] symbiosum]MCB6611409.1 VWA domain-containing protein [[Clostridium] symbiosum]
MNFAEQKLFSRRRKSAVKRNWRQSLAWLLIACLCITNINIAAFAAEIALDGNGLAATPSSATASEADVWMPGTSISGEELLAEAERAVTNGWKFDFDGMLRKLDGESDSENSQNFKKYEDLFDGYSSFILFYDNDEEGMLTGDNKKAYGYILVRLDKKKYMEYREHAGLGNTDSEASASDAEAEESYKLTGDEEIIFLYMNGTGVDATFNLNFEDIETSEIVVPAASYFIEEKEEEVTETTAAPEEQTEEPKEEQPDGEGGGSSGGSGSGSGSENNQGGSEEGNDIAGPEDGTDKDQGTVEDESKSDSGNTETEDGQEGTKPDGGSEEGQGGTKPDSGSEEGQGGTKPDSGSEEGQGGTKPDSGSNEGQGGTKPDGGSDAGQEGTKPDGGSDAGQGGTKSDGGTDADKGDTGNSGSSDKENSQGSTDSGKDNGIDNGHDSNKSSGSSSGTDSGSSSDKGSGSGSGSGSDSGSGTSSGSGSGSDSGSGDSGSSGEQTVSISSYNVVRVMGPNPDASDEDEDDGMSFEEWAEDDEDEEDDEEYDDYDDYDYGSYEYDEDGTIYLNMTFLPAAAMQSRKAQSKARFFRSAKAENEQVSVQASVAAVSDFTPTIQGYHKQIKHLGGDDYELHLDVSGSGQGTDVLLIIDRSGSMGGSMGTLKNILANGYWSNGTYYKSFVDTIFGQSAKSRFAVISYGETSKINLEWSGNTTTIKKTITGLNTNGGTNYEDALYDAAELLKSRSNSGNVPIVIFLSDGQPTFYNKHPDEKNKDIFNEYSSSYGVGGTGSSTSDKTSSETLNAGRKFNEIATEKGATVYGMQFAGAAKKYFEPIVYGTNIPDKTTRIFTSGSNKLEELFGDMLESLKLRNVRIDDTLSKYVELPSNWKETAKVYKKTNSGRTSLTEGRDYESLTYNADIRMVSLVFGEKKTLDDDAVYELVFNITASSTAKAEGPDGYNATGDVNTDYEGNDTSSTKDGFYSNDEAILSYGENNELKLKYPKPVIQVTYVPEPEHRKYIEDKKNGTFELTLDVTSPVGSSTETIETRVPADVMFILDKSGSMEYSIPGSDRARYELVNDAIERVVEGLAEYDVYYKGIHFPKSYYGGLEIKPSETDWLKVSSNYQSEINISDPNGGTYPNGALTKGIELLNSGSPENRGKDGVKKHIIFLTDGDPTNDSESTDTNIKKAIASLSSDTSLHIIACGVSASSKYLTGLKKKAEEKGATVTSQGAYSAGDINAVFTNIKNSIISSVTESKPGITGVTITDTLSEYAEFVNPNSTDDVKILMDGIPMSTGEKEKAKPDITKTGKTVTVSFAGDYEFEKDVTYSISFPIKPSAKAFEEYLQNNGGYGEVVGDADTDVPGFSEEEWTSSGKPGFHSNESANVTYIYGTNQKELEYPHPVLQVTQGKMKIRKVVIDGTPEDDGKEFIIHVNGEDYSSVALEDGETSPYIYVDSETTFEITESVPMEYTQAAMLRITDAKTGDPIEDSEGTVTVKPGDDLLVEVYNTYGHKPYFHSWNTVTNYTTGDKNTPFKTSREAAKEAAKNHPKAALTGNDEENLDMEEGEALD